MEVHVSARPNQQRLVDGKYVSVPEDEKAALVANLARIAALYELAAQQVVGKLGIEEVYAGLYQGHMGYDEVKLNNGEGIKNPFPVPTSYTDAKTIWKLAEAPKRQKRKAA